jgi:hypothetical protein
MIVKLCGQPVDFLIGPVVEKIGLGQLWEDSLHRSDVLDGALFDTMAVIRREAGESLLEGMDVEESDRKGADATTGASESAGNFAEQGGGCPLEPVVSFLIERTRVGQSWNCHGRSFLFDGEVDDEMAFGRVKALVINLDDSVALVLVELQDPSVEIIALIAHIIFGEPSREHKPRAVHGLAHDVCFDIVVSE